MKVEILGVLVDNINPEEALKKIEGFLASGRQHYIVTPNPEMVMAAQKDEEFKNILNRADLSIPDGTGLLFASRILGNPIKERVPGVDLVWQLASLAERGGHSLYLLGAEKEDVAKKAAENLQKFFLRLKIAGAEMGGKITNPAFVDKELLERINQAKPDILLVAFGAPKQEKWIYHHLPKFSSVKVAIGVGGTFDFISGEIRRAPLFLRKLGLEWLWRLILEPRRWRRILNATAVFGWKAVKFKIFK